jgi:hypothetical protein
MSKLSLLAFRLVLEEWTGLELLADCCQRDPVQLAVRIQDRFMKAFDSLSSPYCRHVLLISVRHVNFRDVAERLLTMLARREASQALDE